MLYFGFTYSLYGCTLVFSAYESRTQSQPRPASFDLTTDLKTFQLTSNDGDTASIGKSFFKTKKSLMNSQYTNSRQVTETLEL